jgi:hypothetical protein
MNQDRHLTPDELLERWGRRIQPQTLRAWRSKNHRKGPPFVKVGSRVLYRLRDVELWEQAARQNPANWGLGT